MNRPDRRFGPVLLLACAATTALAAPPAPFELKDGDRVVLVGGTFIEREPSYGYLEALLTARFPDRNVSFRNLGWSGDTVRGEARARFGPPAEGFAHLKQHVEALKPTVLLVNYGLNESFAGKEGLPAFEKDLNTLLDVLDRTGARIVLITPRRLETLPAPLPNPAKANERLADYVAVLRRAAASRDYRLVDLFDGWKPDPAHPLTDNGVHLGAAGYAEASQVIARALGIGESPGDLAPIAIKNGRTTGTPEGCTVEAMKATPAGLEVRIRDARLAGPNAANRPILVGGLPRGTYTVAIDGKTVGEATSDEKGLAVAPTHGPAHDQAERLRAAIVAKNELYFHRWRPQNETYLFGFRKHEQGNNAREIPLFDPLVAAKEAEIARFRVPAAHTYEIRRKGDAQ